MREEVGNEGGEGQGNLNLRNRPGKEGAGIGGKPLNLANCIYGVGITVSNRGKSSQRKDGSGMLVVVEREIALQPDVAVWQCYFDPKKDVGVRVEGEVVKEFPKIKEFTAVAIRATKVRTDEHTGQVTIKGGELIA